MQGIKELKIRLTGNINVVYRKFNKVKQLL